MKDTENKNLTKDKRLSKISWLAQYKNLSNEQEEDIEDFLIRLRVVFDKHEDFYFHAVG